MPIVDGVRVISRLYRVSPTRQHEIAEHWRAVERERARKRLARTLKPKKGKAESPPTAEERERFRELAVDLARRGLLDVDLDEAAALEIERKLRAWIRAPGRMPWYRFVEALRVERFGPPPPPERRGSRLVEYGDGHLHRTDGW